ncbi:Photosystem I P700 chlorophyll a apoprotein A2 [Spatholobus suberectus]|nr:Photosystem I P700 chlorophyll a apoprotein A2 [Spatholobus suberectus]
MHVCIRHRCLVSTTQLHFTTTLILVKGALDARGSKLMPDKKDFGYSFPCDGPGRGGTCDISAWDAFYLAVFWMLNTIGWELTKTLAWAHERTPLANLIRWRDKPVALSVVQARLVGLAHFSVEISKVPSLSDKWEIHGKLESLPHNNAPIRLHRRCFSIEGRELIIETLDYLDTYFVKWFMNVSYPIQQDPVGKINLVARKAHNLEVTGSNPVSATF